MLSKAGNDRISRVGPGTPMGELLRRYWQPVAATAQLAGQPTKAIRLLGENLVLFRDRSGALGLIGDRCPHRKVNMLYGIPEQDGLRCPYHGWLYNAEGRCTDQPYEQAEDPATTFKDKVGITAYPVQELGGLIFAYLGPQPAPLLPRWDLFVWDDVMKDIGTAVIPCNWVQCMENSLDPVHVEWLHNHFSNYVLERMGRSDLKRKSYTNEQLTDVPWKHEKIGFDVFEHGILKRRRIAGETEENPNWRIGHPVVFPNILRVNTCFQYRVPIDDEHTLHIWYTAHLVPPEHLSPQPEIPFYEVPVPDEDERGNPRWDLLDGNSGQDMLMWYTQGGLVDRSTEHLGLSDKGIILYRRLLLDQLARLEQGEELMNVFRDPDRNQRIDLPWEGQEHRGQGRFTAFAGRRTAAAGKYSPVLEDLLTRVAGTEMLRQPVN